MVITTSFPEQNEGEAAAGLFVQDFVRELAKVGVSVQVVAPASKTNHICSGNIDLSQFAVPRLPLSRLSVKNPGMWIDIAKTLWLGHQAVTQACKRQPPDHIIALWVLPSGLWASLAAKRFGIEYSTWALGSDIWSLSKIPFVRKFLHNVLRGAAHCFADGYQLAADVEAISGVTCMFLASSRQFPYLGTGSPRKPPPYRFAYIGRWHPNKGTDLLIDALKLLSSSDWGLIEKIVIRGGGPLEAQVRKCAEKLQRENRPVELGGYIDRVNAIKLFEWTDFVLIPSRQESIPVVFSDSIQARKPLISTPVGDLPRLIRSRNCGILATSATAEAIAESIQYALRSDPQTYNAGLLESATEFELASTVENFLRTIF